MDKKDVQKLKEIVGHEQEIEKMSKKVSITKDTKNEQYIIKIPKLITKQIQIDTEKDKFEFFLIPKDGKFEVIANLIYGE